MEKCINREPSKRPTFKEIVKELQRKSMEKEQKSIKNFKLIFNIYKI